MKEELLKLWKEYVQICELMSGTEGIYEPSFEDFMRWLDKEK